MKQNRYKTAIVGLFFLCASVVVNAQILNIEKARLDNDTLETFIGNAHFGLNLKQRNSQVLSINGRLNMTLAKPKHNYILIGNAFLIKVQDNDVISDGSVHLRANWLKRKKVSYETFVQAQYDQARGMDYRFLAGNDIRFRLRYSDKITLASGIGFMYEQEGWQGEDELIETKLWKSTNYVSIQNRFSDNFELNCIVYYQARFDTFFEPRVFSDVNLNFKVSKLLSFNSKFSMIYDSAPVIPIRELFYTFTNGITIRF